MIDKTREYLNEFLGVELKFKYKGSRGVVFEFLGVICECYDFVFLIKSDDKKFCFSYNDFIIGVISIA